LGDQLGGRSDDPEAYVNGKIQYHTLASSEEFLQGLERVRKGIESYTVALMCSEKDPIHCHRALLVCRYLREDSYEIFHILEDGTLESHDEFEKRLLRLLNLPERDLFATYDELLEQAYDVQGERIAHSLETEERRSAN
jgi:uncharacterized protein (DUF488 family)